MLFGRLVDHKRRPPLQHVALPAWTSSIGGRPLIDLITPAPPSDTKLVNAVLFSQMKQDSTPTIA
jgi:hypothetical protein